MTADQWVPGRWVDVKVGQSVCLRNADGAEVAITVVDRSPLSYPGNQWVHSGLCRYLTDEWDLFITAPPLPTQQGVYMSKTGGIWQVYGAAGLISVTNPTMCSDPTEFAPFTRLEPAPETAKKVLTALGEYLDGQLSGRTKNDIIGHLSAKFGVTGDLTS